MLASLAKPTHRPTSQIGRRAGKSAIGVSNYCRCIRREGRGLTSQILEQAVGCDSSNQLDKKLEEGLSSLLIQNYPHQQQLSFQQLQEQRTLITMPGEISTTVTNGHYDTIIPKSSPQQTGTTAQAAAAVQPVSNGSHKASSSILHANLASQPPKIIKAEGNYLTTSTGTQIFDATGGAAVSCLGHGHPRVKQAIIDQLDTVEYTYSPFFTTSASEKLAQYLTDSTNGQMSKVFIVSSGTEAIEAGLKLTRQYFVEKGETQRTRFIARNQSYHGNTLGSLAVGGHKARKAIYAPLLSENVSHVSPPYPYRGMNDGESEETYVKRLGQELDEEFQRVGPGNVCAFVAETMSGLVSKPHRKTKYFEDRCIDEVPRPSAQFPHRQTTSPR